jgi:hypothetical protein
VPIRKGEPWGEPGPLAPDGIVVRSDAEARAAVERARREHAPLPELGLLGGDLCRTVGGRGDEDRLHTDGATRLSVDLGSVLLDGRQHWFVAHLVARRSWLRGPIVAAMNAEWLGDWDVAPRAHPNDGLLDVVEADPPLADRWRARRRLRTGAHLPHPAIRLEQTRARQLDLARPLDVWLDGERVGSASAISLRVEPDALRVVV